jgi:hypothetical protein
LWDVAGSDVAGYTTFYVQGFDRRQTRRRRRRRRTNKKRMNLG